VCASTSICGERNYEQAVVRRTEVEKKNKKKDKRSRKLKGPETNVNGRVFDEHVQKKED
jgi:hypothetical protein